jgi:hypothetical protein
MSGVKVVLANENPAYAGVVSFEGEVVEALGFADTVGQRLPIEVIDEVELEDSMLHVLSNPEKGDSYGIELPIKPSDEERAALQELADTIQSAAGGGG